MTIPAWDLDAPVSTDRVVTGTRLGPAMLLAIGLAGLGLGALVGSALTPPSPPRFPATATLNIRDLYVDTSAPATGPSAAPVGEARPRNGDAVVVFRLQVHNPGAEPVGLTGLLLDGVTRTSSLLPLDMRVAGHSSTAVDLTMHPDCSPDRDPVRVRARLRLTRSDGSDPDTVRIAPSRTLSELGGLCSQLDSELPNGWRAPLQANTSRLQGIDLEISMDDLSGARLAGILVDDRLLPTVFVGDQLLPTSARLRPGEATRLLLRGPPPCIGVSGTSPIPSTLRLLAEGDQGMHQRLVIVGPALARWLRLDCGIA